MASELSEEVARLQAELDECRQRYRELKEQHRVLFELALANHASAAAEAWIKQH